MGRAGEATTPGEVNTAAEVTTLSEAGLQLMRSQRNSHANQRQNHRGAQFVYCQHPASSAPNR